MIVTNKPTNLRVQMTLNEGYQDKHPENVGFITTSTALTTFPSIFLLSRIVAYSVCRFKKNRPPTGRKLVVALLLIPESLCAPPRICFMGR